MMSIFHFIFLTKREHFILFRVMINGSYCDYKKATMYFTEIGRELLLIGQCCKLSRRRELVGKQIPMLLFKLASRIVFCVGTYNCDCAKNNVHLPKKKFHEDEE